MRKPAWGFSAPLPGGTTIRASYPAFVIYGARGEVAGSHATFPDALRAARALDALETGALDCSYCGIAFVGGDEVATARMPDIFNVPVRVHAECARIYRARRGVA